MKIRVVGPWFGTSGYSSHVRGLSRGLAAAGADVRVGCQKPPDWVRWVNDEELQWLSKEQEQDETMIYVGLPPSWRIGYSDRPKKFIGFLVWEGDKIPLDWLSYLADPLVDQIWVPSKHVYDAVQNTWRTWIKKRVEEIPGTTFEDVHDLKTVHIVPHGFDPKIFYPQETPSDGPFTFVCNKGWNNPEDRGGIQYAIKAFREEFKPEENVRLLVKLNTAYAQITDLQAYCHSILNAAGVPGDDRIQFLVQDLTDKDVAGFLRQGHVFVSPTRAEAFNLAGLEAKACGLPTIQTGFGGNTDYMDPDIDWFVGYDLAEVKHDLAYEGIQWATPSITDLRACMRKAFEDGIQSMRQRGLEGSRRVSGFTWKATGEKALKLLEDKHI